MGELRRTFVVKRRIVGGSIGASQIACTPRRRKGGCLATFPFAPGRGHDRKEIRDRVESDRNVVGEQFAKRPLQWWSDGMIPPSPALFRRRHSSPSFATDPRGEELAESWFDRKASYRVIRTVIVRESKKKIPGVGSRRWMLVRFHLLVVISRYSVVGCSWSGAAIRRHPPFAIGARHRETRSSLGNCSAWPTTRCRAKRLAGDWDCADYPADTLEVSCAYPGHVERPKARRFVSVSQPHALTA